jgi:uncharacterized OB-fold protein
MTAIAERPVPEPDEESYAFFQGARDGKLMIQRCSQCNTAQCGSLICNQCFGGDLHWENASGRGKLHSFVVMHLSYHPAFNSAKGYNAAVVELDEGPRLFSNIVGAAPDTLRIGQRVRVRFALTGDTAIPEFFLDNDL